MLNTKLFHKMNLGKWILQLSLRRSAIELQIQELVLKSLQSMRNKVGLVTRIAYVYSKVQVLTTTGQIGGSGSICTWLPVPSNYPYH